MAGYPLSVLVSYLYRSKHVGQPPGPGQCRERPVRASIDLTEELGERRMGLDERGHFVDRRLPVHGQVATRAAR